MAKVTGQFGEKRSYYKPGKFHEGVDLAFDLNTPIKAYSGGTVSKIGFDPFGYGRYIKIKSPDGAEQIYAHANKIHKKVGDLINLGDEIGLVGSTGRSTGPHLHFGNYINGKAVNPMNLVNGLPPITPVLGKANVSTNNDDVINEYAKNYLAKNQELEAKKLALQENNLKIINDILSQPQRRVTPVSLEEVLLAPKGEKLATYAEYMKSPRWKKSMGNLFGTYRFDPKTGEAVGLGDIMGEEAAQGYANLQKAAAAQNKSRNDMVLELMKEFGVNDRFDKDLGFKTQKQVQDYEISKEKNNIEKAYKEGLITNSQKELLIKESEAKEKVRHNKAPENIALEKKAEKEVKKQKDNAKEKELLAIRDQLGNFKRLFSVMPSKTNAMTVGILRQKTGTQTAGESEFNTRSTLLFNTIARTLGGEKGVLSDQDIQRVKEGMPQLTDSRAQKEAKMKAIEDLLNVRAAQYGVDLGLNKKQTTTPKVTNWKVVK